MLKAFSLRWGTLKNVPIISTFTQYCSGSSGPCKNIRRKEIRDIELEREK